jgi:hypothetical protein
LASRAIPEKRSPDLHDQAKQQWQPLLEEGRDTKKFQDLISAPYAYSTTAEVVQR